MSEHRLLLIALLAGLLLPLGFSSLPTVSWWGWLVLLLVLLPASRRPLGRMLLACALGLIWSLAWHQGQLSEQLPQQLDNQVLELEGTVTALPEQTETGWRFMLQDVHSLDGQRLPLMRLHWWGGDAIRAGERWQLSVRLRAPRGMRNPGTFDYEAWLYAQHIGAVGSVRGGHRLAAAPALGQWRDRLQQHLGTSLASADNRRLLALLVGDRQALSDADWDVLQRTGTSHLLVISGLHVGMLALAFFLLVQQLVRWLPWHWPWPQLWLSAPLALCAAASYALLAGMAVPVQRALLMCAAALLLKLWRRAIGPVTLWLLAMCMVVLANPAAPLRAGFWLSFIAVGLLILGMGGRLHNRGLWWRWGRAQWVAFIGLWPWLVLWGMPASGASMLINLVAIPWISLLVVPLALLGSLLQLVTGLDQLLLLAASSLNLFMGFLSWAAGWSPLIYLPFPGWWGWCLALVGSLMLLLPGAATVRPLALFCLLPLLLAEQPRPAQGQLRVVVLDVGQGLSVLLQTAEHDLLYDAGARLASGFDLGEAVVVPSLSALGVEKLDVLLISHGDNDHAGGAFSVSRMFPAGRLIAGEPERLLGLSAEPCQHGERWQWDGVEFQLLRARLPAAPANGQSCVLQVTASGQAVLLPGDIRQIEEYALLSALSPAEVLLAPHHGSRSSSSYAFIRRLNPDWVVFSAGYHSPYGHPHPQVVQRYRELGSNAIYTGQSGAVGFMLGRPGQVRPEWRWREAARRFWHQ
ncbi:DNA internalization-related competence protein ComEC/Rec2 [Halopseudomonas maritima]|uniref:DNA internalization-related competence protein ComEC/Rec2 n=1 Tax=Halopseudomonas maritima TaxID=2918528 RepID=UPI001EE9F5B2|nr:DNA internalization-related competence protein ComEC/Rec2 [Halopseudomonas maritima]UJJ31263.1 DNA internalization-related competence protein ComEC/Rec2 [Halopseudomonas maritima]